MYIKTINYCDPTHLAEVMAEMEALGAPVIRVIDCGDRYCAIEGSHRLTAARELGLTPEIEIIEDGVVPEDVQGFEGGDWDALCEWATDPRDCEMIWFEGIAA